MTQAPSSGDAWLPRDNWTVWWLGGDGLDWCMSPQFPPGALRRGAGPP